MPLTVENGILQHKPKKAEIKRLTNDLAKQQHALARKEAELADLRATVSAEEREISLLTKEVGSRDQRVDLGTLHGGPKAKQVGGEMATAIRRRMLRQQATLREKVNRDKGRLDDDIGYNKRLRREIEQRRLERLNHMQGVKLGQTQLERATSDISGMIVAAQRAYAERENCTARIAELRREVEQDAATWGETAAALDGEVEALEDECRARDRETAELEADVMAAVAVAQEEEESQERELEHYASVRNKRLELAHGLEHVFQKLGVTSVEEVVDAYMMTASKILSLWAKHGEQEQEMERLDGETKALNREAETREEAEAAALSPAAAGAAGGGADDDGAVGATLEAREAALATVCAAVADDEHAAVVREVARLGGGGGGGGAVAVNEHNLLAILGLLEAAAVRAARRHRELIDLASTTARRRDSEFDPANPSSAATPRNPADGTTPRDASSEAAGSLKNSARGPGGGGERVGKRKPPSIVPPSMEGIIASSQRAGEASERIVGLGEQRFGRRSLKSELMSQILAGVHTQMVNMKEEEILVKIGEKTREASATPEINKQARDESIEAFVNKRRTTSTSSANLLGGFDSSSRAGSLAESKESSPRRKKGGGLRGNRSAPQLFGGASKGGGGGGSAVFESLTRINSDVGRARALAASCLPKTVLAPPPVAEAAHEPPAAAARRRPPAGARGGGDRSVAEIQQRLLELQRERDQIDELKAMALSAGRLGLMGGE